MTVRGAAGASAVALVLAAMALESLPARPSWAPPADASGSRRSAPAVAGKAGPSADVPIGPHHDSGPALASPVGRAPAEVERHDDAVGRSGQRADAGLAGHRAATAGLSGHGVDGSPADAPPCSFVPGRRVNPERVPLEGEVAITTSLRADCATDPRNLHLVVVVDASAENMRAWGRDWLAVLLSDLETALVSLDPGRRARLRVGLVSFSAGLAQTHQHLTGEVDELVAALHNVALASSESPLGGLGNGMREARRVLQLGREPGVPVREAILLASRGYPSVDCDAVRVATGEVRSLGVLLVTACGGGECDRRCLGQAATAPQFAFASNAWGYLGLALAQIIDASGPFYPVEAVTIVDELSDRVVYTGGGDPNAGLGNRLEWTFRPWPSAGVTRTYRARAVDFGRFALSSRAYAVVHFDPALWSAPTHTLELGSPWLEVLPVAVSPTPTEDDREPPTATLTPTGTATPRPTLTASPSPTPTPTLRVPQAFLPVLLNAECGGGSVAIDVAMVIDVSGSMQVQDVDPLLSRWHAAREVALDLVRSHLGPRDRVAVVPFAGSAEVVAGLADDRARAIEALEALPRWNGSRLDIGIDVATSELLAGSRPDARPSIVLLTDADLNQAERDAVGASASRARASGVAIYAAGLGRDADPDIMAEVTGTRGRVYLSERVRVLSLSDAVARDLHCRR